MDRTLPWRVLLPATFLPLWAAFALLPQTQPLPRWTAALAVAALAGAGTELAIGEPGHHRSAAVGGGLRWILPFGAVLCLLALLCQLRGPLATTPLPPLAAAAVLGVVALEAGMPALAQRHALLLGGLALLGYAEALVAFGLAPLLGSAAGLLISLAAAVGAAIVRLAPRSSTPEQLMGRTALVAFLFAESLAVIGTLAVAPPVGAIVRLLALIIALEGATWSLVAGHGRRRGSGTRGANGRIDPIPGEKERADDVSD